jgi:hypothetical protein
MSEIKKYDPTFAFYASKSGNGYTAKITQELADLVQANVGGILFLKDKEDRKHDRMPEKEAVVLPVRKGL